LCLILYLTPFRHFHNFGTTDIVHTAGDINVKYNVNFSIFVI